MAITKKHRWELTCIIQKQQEQQEQQRMNENASSTNVIQKQEHGKFYFMSQSNP